MKNIWCGGKKKYEVENFLNCLLGFSLLISLLAIFKYTEACYLHTVFRPVSAWIHMGTARSPTKLRVTTSGMWPKRIFCSPPLLLGEALFEASKGLGLAYAALLLLSRVSRVRLCATP